MNQGTHSGGKSVTVRYKKVMASEVLNNNRLKLFGVSLKDWLICTECRRQQVNHAFDGANIPTECHYCGAEKDAFSYFSEYAASVSPTRKLRRFVRNQ